MKRIYKVTTPAGVRLVEADTRGQAISHCMTGDYTAAPVNSSEMWTLIQSGAQVEKAIVTAREPKAKPATVQAAPQPRAPAVVPALPKAAPPRAAAPKAAPAAKAQAWTPPEGVHPVIAEQQRINPTAAAVAGVPPKRAPILATRASAKPATPPVAPSQGGDAAWQTRGDDDEEAEDNCAVGEE